MLDSTTIIENNSENTMVEPTKRKPETTQQKQFWETSNKNSAAKIPHSIVSVQSLVHWVLNIGQIWARFQRNLWAACVSRFSALFLPALFNLPAKMTADILIEPQPFA